MRKTEGITLIALVITIIVLLILAGVAISMLSGDNGILKQAANAKKETEKQSTLESIRLASMSALSSGNGKIESEQGLTTLNDELKEAGYEGTNIEILPVDIEVNGEHYAIEEDGKAKIAKWYYGDEGKKTITNGTITLKIGDIVTNYNPGIDENGDEVTAEYTSPKEKNGYGDQKFTATSYTGEWAILGVEAGQILIMPTTNVTTSSNADGKMYLGYNNSTDKTSAIKLENTKKSMQYGVEELDKIGAVYGDGRGATKSRSIKEEDINKVTGYKYNYCKGLLYGYGNKVTYTINNDNKVECTWYKNNVLQTEEPSDYKTFVYFNGSTWEKLGVGESKTLTSTYYWYFPQTLSQAEPDTTNTIGITSDSNEYKMLFKEGENNTSYWIGSSFMYSNPGDAIWGIRNVQDSRVRGYNFISSINAYCNSDQMRTRC